MSGSRDIHGVQVEEGEDDWEEIHAHPDREISAGQDSAVDADFIHIDHPRSTKYAGRHVQDPEEAPQGPIPTLRRALYTLKDTLRDCMQHYELLPASLFAADTRPQMEYIFSAQKRLLEALNVLLTNYAADWERLAQEGGMTFDEFVSLDVGAVGRVTTVIREFAQASRAWTFSPRAEPGEDDVITLGKDEVRDVVASVELLGQMLKIPVESVEGPRDIEDAVIEHKSTAVGEQKRKSPLVGSVLEGGKTDHDKKIHATMMSVSDW